MSRFIYLDHGATSFPKAPGVTQAVARFLDEEAGNPGRGGHRLSVAAARTIEAARERVADLLGGSPERTLFGPSATFWLNTILERLLERGDRVVTSALEHNAVMRPLRHLQEQRAIDVAVAAGEGASGVPSADEIAAHVEARPTRLVVISHASNVSGAILPVSEIARRVAPVPVVVDGAQTAGNLPLDFATTGVAAFICSGHKGLLGPPGTGVMLLAPGFAVDPLVRGGTGSRSESELMPKLLPDRLEAGTPNGAGIAGLGAACRWVAERGIEVIRDHESRRLHQLHQGLRTLPGVAVKGRHPEGDHTGVLSFAVAGVDNGDLAAWLDRERGILLRAGLHCAPAAHRRLATFPDGTLRAGIGPFNTDDDVDALIDAIRDAATGAT